MMRAISGPSTVPPLPATDPAKAAKTWKAATDFEAMTVNQMLQPMFDTIDSSGDMFSGGAGEAQFKPMLVDEMAKTMQQAGGFGLASSIYQQMLKMQDKTS